MGMDTNMTLVDNDFNIVKEKVNEFVPYNLRTTFCRLNLSNNYKHFAHSLDGATDTSTGDGTLLIPTAKRVMFDELRDNLLDLWWVLVKISDLQESEDWKEFDGLGFDLMSANPDWYVLVTGDEFDTFLGYRLVVYS